MFNHYYYQLLSYMICGFFFFSSRRRHTRLQGDWSSDVCSSDLSLELKPGDALIFFTDGVVEAFNEAGEEFGNERWLSAIRSLPDWDASQTLQFRSEERRVGKECRSRWSPYH